MADPNRGSFYSRDAPIRPGLPSEARPVDGTDPNIRLSRIHGFVAAPVPSSGGQNRIPGFIPAPARSAGQNRITGFVSAPAPSAGHNRIPGFVSAPAPSADQNRIPGFVSAPAPSADQNRIPGYVPAPSYLRSRTPPEFSRSHIERPITGSITPAERLILARNCPISPCNGIHSGGGHFGLANVLVHGENEKHRRMFGDTTVNETERDNIMPHCESTPPQMPQATRNNTQPFLQSSDGLEAQCFQNLGLGADSSFMPLRQPYTKTEPFLLPGAQPPNSIRGRTQAPHSTSWCGLPRPITKTLSLDPINNLAKMPEQPTHTVTSGALHDEWANAPEFVPKAKPKSYAEVVNPKTEQQSQIDEVSSLQLQLTEPKLCPYNLRTGGACRLPSGSCPFLHGDVCDICGNPALHPTNIDLRNEHTEKCLAQNEREKELTCGLERSRDKTCGICFEIVLEKQIHERRFGILNHCCHCFCLVCIRKWRNARNFENKVVRACPECRVKSDFVCPSVYWVETKEDKDKLIEKYKNALSEKQCKYFNEGRGRCPFGNKCFYLHALPDGTKTDVGPPPRRRRDSQLHYSSDEGEIGDMLQQIILWDFLDDHDHHWLYSFADDIEELVAFFSDSDDSEWSDYELLLD